MRAVEENQRLVSDKLDLIQKKLNEALKGENLAELIPIMMRISRGEALPPWFSLLQQESRLPNLDGKTVGSVIEKLLVCVVERDIFHGSLLLSVNPAHGIDIPELELGVKSPSTNYDTSEPYFSAYERLLGNEYDAIILLTNYQEAKGRTPFCLQIIKTRYLHGTEIADAKLCAMARRLRQQLTDEWELKKAIRFLAYINQSDWEAQRLLRLIDEVILDGKDMRRALREIETDYEAKNEKRFREAKALIPEDALARLLAVANIRPENHAVITAAENWVILTQKDNGRYPNDNEWHRLLTGPLNGKISMSFALQWRYNFRGLFG